MKQIVAVGPKTNLTITDAEIEAAKSVKEDVKGILKKLDKATKTILDLRDAITQQHPSQDELANKYHGRLLRYRHKIIANFNDFFHAIKETIEKLTAITDPDMMRLKEILVAEISELSDGAEAVLDLLKETDKDGFTNTLEQISAQIDKRQKSIKDVIESQLLGHIDQDILGKMKIGDMQFRIRRRARIIKQLARRA